VVGPPGKGKEGGGERGEDGKGKEGVPECPKSRVGKPILNSHQV